MSSWCVCSVGTLADFSASARRIPSVRSGSWPQVMTVDGGRPSSFACSTLTSGSFALPGAWKRGRHDDG